MNAVKVMAFNHLDKSPFYGYFLLHETNDVGDEKDHENINKPPILQKNSLLARVCFSIRSVSDQTFSTYVHEGLSLSSIDNHFQKIIKNCIF